MTAEPIPLNPPKPSPVDPPPVHVALARIFADLPSVGKDEFNEQQKFKFRGIEAMEAALRPLLAREGVFAVSHVEELRLSERTTRNGGIMNVVHAHVVFRFYGPAGDHLDVDAWGEAADSGDKATPKATTGAWKAVLGKMFCFTDRDSDQDQHTQDETVDWYVANGWKDEYAHEDWKKVFVDRLRVLPDEAKKAFREWREGEKLDFAVAWTFEEAQRAEERAQEIAVEAGVA